MTAALFPLSPPPIMGGRMKIVGSVSNHVLSCGILAMAFPCG
jgi:hypothetical protein